MYDENYMSFKLNIVHHKSITLLLYERIFEISFALFLRSFYSCFVLMNLVLNAIYFVLAMKTDSICCLRFVSTYSINFPVIRR